MLLLLALVACSAGPPAAPTAPPDPKVRVALDWYPEPEFGGFYAASLGGAYKAHHLDVELVPGGPGVPVLELLQAGKAEVAISGGDDLLVKRQKGLDAVAIYAAFQHSPTGIMTHVDGATRYEDLSGNVAIEAGSPFQQFLAKKYAWEGKVQMVPPTGSVGPFATDAKLSQQAYITSEPCLIEARGLRVNFLPAHDAGWDPYAVLAVVAGKDQAAPWVKEFVAATREGWESYLRDPAAANAEIVKLNPNMKAETMGCITGKQASYVRSGGELGAMSEERWQATVDALATIDVKADATGAWVSP